MRAFADRQGRVHLFYRAATERVDRDMYLLSSENRGQSFSGTLLDKWKLNACPMSSAALADGATELLAAWETQGQVYFASLDQKKGQPVSPIRAPGTTGKRRHPVITANSLGETMLAVPSSVSPMKPILAPPRLRVL